MSAIKKLIDMMCTYDKDPDGLAQRAKEEFAVLDTLISQLPTVPSEMKWVLVSSTPLSEEVIMTEDIRVDSQMGDIHPHKIKGVVVLKEFKPKHPYFGGRTTDDVNTDEPKSLEGVDDVTVEWHHFPFSKPTLDVHSDETPINKMISALTSLKDNPGTIFSISSWFKGCKLYIDGKVVGEEDKNFLFTLVYDGEQPLLVGLEDLWGRKDER